MIAYKLFVVLAVLGVLQWIFLVFTKAEAKADAAEIDADGSRNSLGKTWHRQSFLKVAALGLAAALPILWLSVPAGVSFLLLEGAEFWLLFDLWLNRARRMPDNYVGHTAATDKFFRQLSPDNPEQAMGRAKAAAIVLFGLATLFFLIQWFLKL